MVDTNALLSIAFSLITSFTNVVSVPSDAVPHDRADLTKILVGSPSSPTDLYLVDRKGTEFSISGGVVYRYRSPGSYFELQDPKLIPSFEGTSTMDSNDVIHVTASVLQRLIKTQDPLLNESNGAPKIIYPGPRRGGPIPFFRVIWPRISRGPEKGAEVEIDGRTGTIVFIHLWDSAFRDPVAAKRIREQVYTAPPKPVTDHISAVRKFHLPQPTTNQISEGIANWLIFCAKLGVDPGGQTNVSDVDWDKTVLYKEADFSTNVPAFSVWFKNGASFNSIGGTVVGHFAPDACYATAYTMRPREEWRRYTGKFLKREDDLVKNLETVMIEKLGIPASLMAQFRTLGPSKPQEIEDDDGQIMTINRALVDWRNWPRNAGRTVWVDETRLGIMAEFNLETGALEFLAFMDPEFIEALHHGPLPSNELAPFPK